MSCSWMWRIQDRCSCPAVQVRAAGAQLRCHGRVCFVGARGRVVLGRQLDQAELDVIHREWLGRARIEALQCRRGLLNLGDAPRSVSVILRAIVTSSAASTWRRLVLSAPQRFASARSSTGDSFSSTVCGFNACPEAPLYARALQRRLQGFFSVFSHSARCACASFRICRSGLGNLDLGEQLLRRSALKCASTA